MAEQSGFFDAHLVDGEYDRVYLSEHFANYFASFIGNGVFGKKSNELIVKQEESANMSVKVLSGQAWINGYWYENTSDLSLTIDIADGVLNRIDSIVVRWHNIDRTIRTVVKKGVSASNPVAPAVQRDNDFYELKLADVYVKAGATNITQANITDKRLDTSVCGLVIGVVQQLDEEEFGIQLDTFIQEFMQENNEWKERTRGEQTVWLANFKSSCNNWFDTLKIDTEQGIESLVEHCNELVQQTIDENQQRFDDVVGAMEEIAKNNDISSIITDIQGIKTNVTNMTNDISALERLSLESGQYPGCFYRMINGDTEWINPPSMPGFEYLTTERWNGKKVYQRTVFTASLPRKSVMSIHFNANIERIVSLTGFAINKTTKKHHEFPIIISGVTPVAFITNAEGYGGDTCDVNITTIEDMSLYEAYITMKYTKE